MATSGRKTVLPVEKKSTPLSTFLKNVQLRDVINTREFLGKELFTVNSEDTIAKALQLLNRAKIHALPVKKGDNIIGLVDLLDIVKYLVANSKSLGDVNIAESDTAKTQVEKVMNYSHKDPMITLYEGSNAFSAAEILGRGMHRVLVFNDQKQVTGLCSQSDFIAYLSTRLDQPAISSFMQASLGESCGGMPSAMFDAERGPQILHIEPNKTVLEGMEKLARTGASALAVVEPNSGDLVGDFDVADLRGMGYENIKESLADHLRIHGKRKPTVMSYDQLESLGNIVSTLAKDRQRHLWMGEGQKPNAIVTLTDVIRCCVGLA